MACNSARGARGKGAVQDKARSYGPATFRDDVRVGDTAWEGARLPGWIAQVNVRWCESIGGGAC